MGVSGEKNQQMLIGKVNYSRKLYMFLGIAISTWIQKFLDKFSACLKNYYC